MANDDIRDKTGSKEMVIKPSTLETIDAAMLEWVDKELDIYTTTNEGWKKIPVRFVSPERAFITKNDKELRDSKGALVFPQISVERVSLTKDLHERGGFGMHLFDNNDKKGGSYTIAKRIRQDKTIDRAIVESNKMLSEKTVEDYKDLTYQQLYGPVENRRVVYEVVSVPFPVYVTIMYGLNVRTEYAQQMNDVMSAILSSTGAINSFVLHRDGHFYESFIQDDYSIMNNISEMQTEERRFESQIQIKVIGYIIGANKNQEKPKIVVRETAPDIEIKAEVIVKGEIPQ